jgi:hypothetical protein
MLNNAWTSPWRVGDHLGWMIVGRQILDRLEPAGSSGGKAVENPDLLEYEAEIGGKFGHGRVLVYGRHGGRLL